MTFDTLVHYFLICCIVVLAVTALFCLARVIIGPRLSDRIVGVNMIGTQVVITIALVALFLGEEGLADIAIVYSLLSFLAVVVLTKIYDNIYQIYLEKKAKEASKHEQKEEYKP